jgi:hypothetical protein
MGKCRVGQMPVDQMPVDQMFFDQNTWNRIWPWTPLLMMCNELNLYYKNMTIVNDATSWSVILKSLIMLLELSITCQLCSHGTFIVHVSVIMIVIFFSAGHRWQCYKIYFFSSLNEILAKNALLSLIFECPWSDASILRNIRLGRKFPAETNSLAYFSGHWKTENICLKALTAD